MSSAVIGFLPVSSGANTESCTLRDIESVRLRFGEGRGVEDADGCGSIVLEYSEWWQWRRVVGMSERYECEV